jgi:amino acid transporter
MMLTEDEKRYLEYWEANRLRKKKVWRNLSVGLPLGVAIVTAIIISVFSGWFTRAQMVLNTNGPLFLIIVIASVGIVIFTTVFSANHRWEMNEQHYQELLAKKDRP